jgi:hypothetical protein
MGSADVRYRPSEIDRVMYLLKSVEPNRYSGGVLGARWANAAVAPSDSQE